MPRLPVRPPQGFTLVEVLVISPIIILFIGTFIALAVNLTGESLQLRAKNVAAYDVQTALDDIEESVAQATAFQANTNGVTYMPQGKNNDTTPFTNSNASQDPETLIIRSAATTKRPTDPTREVIFSGAGSTCDSRNAVYTYVTVFFVRDGSLYKRTIMPQVPACAPAWQRGSCHADQMSVYPMICKAQDEKLLEGVTDVDIDYFENASAADADKLADTNVATATSVLVKITLAKQAGGRQILYESSTRATSFNAQTSESEQQLPTNPPITFSRAAATPYLTQFSWQPVGSATGGYNVRYRVGTSTWTGPVNTTQPTYSVQGDARKQNVDIEVSVVTNSGTYLYGTLDTAIPRWNDCTYGGTWVSYGSPFSQASFTKTSSGIVGLRGLVKSGAIGSTICTLPDGFKPKFAGEKLIFQVAGLRGGANSWARVDVLSTGEVVAVDGDPGWISLDGIMFLANTTNYSWPDNAWSSTNGWSWYGTGHSNLRSTFDSVGRVHVQGLGKRTGAVTAATITSLGAGKGVSNNTHSPALSAGGAGAVNITTAGDVAGRVAANNHTWQQLQLIYHPSSFSSWNTMALNNSWTNYGGGWPTAKCYKGPDDVVIMTGLINRSANGNGLEIANTVSAGCGSYADGRLLLHAFLSGEAPGRIDIMNGASGTTIGSMVGQLTNHGWTSLDGVRFIAD